MGWAATARRLVRSPEAGVAEGPGAHGAAREPGGRAARGVAHQCRAGAGAGPPVSNAPRDWGQECLALGDGSVRVARGADAKAGEGLRGPHADALPEWPGVPGTRDDAGREWLYTDDGQRDGLGLGALAAPEHAHAVIAGPVGPGQCAPPDNRDGGARPAVTDRPLALPGDRGAASGCGPEGRAYIESVL